ncbi:E3 ubiquitin-protein ligase ATL41-like [Cynara cardunculus var. scolymus]|uniref:RING-type E3 ubiquitin transferase n=1 Tax=Cynara cardunculus var. scolymus TaxID=59895 RepID=A0A103Y890_CYNCS|nr:E3 ubiquitin-protein ligase ATL41-like [Cynara cardunculus var. scolymus]KVI04331.1 Zinc finger, RING/FYVE/PHD-type [Cynara cardunculus var. scolymus]
MSDGQDDEDSQFFPRGSSPDLNSRILLTAIISLSVVVVVVTMLHVYARCILRRQARRRSAIRDIGLIARIHSDEQPKRGLESSVITSLPILVFKGIDHHGRPDDAGVSQECAVCLSMFEDGHMIRVLPNCKHHFHAECIDKWLGSQSTCPICRHEVEPGPTILPLPREPGTGLGSVRWDPPSAPPIQHTGSISIAVEGTSDDQMVQSSEKASGTNSRLSSFRRMLSWERSSQHIRSRTEDDGIEDLER